MANDSLVETGDTRSVEVLPGEQRQEFERFTTEVGELRGQVDTLLVPPEPVTLTAKQEQFFRKIESIEGNDADAMIQVELAAKSIQKERVNLAFVNRFREFLKAKQWGLKVGDGVYGLAWQKDKNRKQAGYLRLSAYDREKHEHILGSCYSYLGDITIAPRLDMRRRENKSMEPK